MKRRQSAPFSKPASAPLNGAGPGQGPSIKQQIIARNIRAAKQRKARTGSAKTAVKHEEMHGAWSDTFEYMNERVARDLKGFYVVYKRNTGP